MAPDVDKPACVASRHALEQARVLTFDHISQMGSSVFFKDVGDIHVGLSCITDPTLSTTLDDWRARNMPAAQPPNRLLDLLTSQGALVVQAPEAQVHAIAAKCLTAALADGDGEGEVRADGLDVDCSLSPDKGGSAIISLSRRRPP